VIAADTPRTKAAKWLQGESVTPPKKVSKMSQSEQALQSAKGNAPGEVSAAQKATSGNSASFWTEMEKLKRQDSALIDDYMATDMEKGMDHNEDDDVLAPSPVKPIKAGVKVNKGKQRDIAGMFDLLGASESSQKAKPTNGAASLAGNAKSQGRDSSSASRDTDVFASTSTSFFSSTNPLPPRIARSRSPSSGPGVSNGKPAKSKKRTSTLAALQPFDALADESDEDNEEKTRLRVEKNKEEVILNALQEEGPDKPKSKPSRGGKRLRSEARAPKPMDQEKEDIRTVDREAKAPDQPIDDEALAEEDDYDIRDLSDEYESYSSRKMLEEDTTESTADEDALDASIDPNLVSLLSLRTSPVKNRLSRLHKKRDETVSKLLLEPTYLMKEKKEKERKGLEDLSDEEIPGEVLHQSDNETKDDVLAAASDDDWASEPEGWKDLGDGEMDGLDW
jgi:hypothetical protein